MKDFFCGIKLEEILQDSHPQGQEINSIDIPDYLFT